MISPAPSCLGYRFPSDIIAYAIWLYFRFSLSFHDGEDLLAPPASRSPMRQSDGGVARFAACMPARSRTVAGASATSGTS